VIASVILVTGATVTRKPQLQTAQTAAD